MHLRGSGKDSQLADRSLEKKQNCLTRVQWLQWENDGKNHDEMGNHGKHLMVGGILRGGTATDEL